MKCSEVHMAGLCRALTDSDTQALVPAFKLLQESSVSQYRIIFKKWFGRLLYRLLFQLCISVTGQVLI